MQVAGDKAAAILGVGDRVSSAIVKAKTIGVIRIGAEVRIATTEKIRRTGSIVRVFGELKVRVRSSGKS
jgi:hypothetical protein